VHTCLIVVGGDLNIHVHDADDGDARRLSDLLATFDMVQHVNQPTHRYGGILDLLMTFSDFPLDEVSVDPADIYSDHALVTCRLPVTVGRATIAERLVRGWRRVDCEVLRHALEDSPLCRSAADNIDVDELFAQYNSVLRDIADRLAPTHAIRRPASRLAPWFDTSCRNARRQCCRLKRHYRRTRTTEDHRLWVDAARSRFRLYRAKREAY